MKELSGGWVMRAYLARLLVMEPDLLMLDEPTNHLDLHSLQWFQNYLKGYQGAILMISHDREFLNALTDSIDSHLPRQAASLPGNYDSFLQQKAQREEQAWAAYRARQVEIKKIEEFIARFRAKATKAAQAQSRIKQLEKMERLQPPSPPEATVRLRFPPAAENRSKGRQPHRDRPSLRQEQGLREHGIRGGTRRPHRAGRSERRREIDDARRFSQGRSSSRRGNASSA